MVSVEAYTINEYVLYMTLMYIAIVVAAMASYLSYVMRDKTDSYRFWSTVAAGGWFSMIVFFDFRIGHIFFAIGVMTAISISNIVSSVQAYLNLEEEWYDA